MNTKSHADVGRRPPTTTQRFKPGDRVVPRVPCQLTYGYVRGTTDRGYLIYWPELRETGDGWGDDDLE